MLLLLLFNDVVKLSLCVRLLLSFIQCCLLPLSAGYASSFELINRLISMTSIIVWRGSYFQWVVRRCTSGLPLKMSWDTARGTNYPINRTSQRYCIIHNSTIWARKAPFANFNRCRVQYEHLWLKAREIVRMVYQNEHCFSFENPRNHRSSTQLPTHKHSTYVHLVRHFDDIKDTLLSDPKLFPGSVAFSYLLVPDDRWLNKFVSISVTGIV